MSEKTRLCLVMGTPMLIRHFQPTTGHKRVFVLEVRMSEYRLGINTFTSKEAIRKFVSVILHSHRPGDKLHGDEAQIISQLLTWHPDADQKMGIGIDYIFIGKDDFNGPCFWVKRLDGTQTDFSFRICIYGDPSKYQQFCSACRAAVEDQTSKYYQPGFDTHHTGTSFAKIVAEFVEFNHLDVENIQLQEGDGMMTRRFVDNNLASLFQLHHHQCAQLESIPRDMHKEITRAQKAQHA